MQKTPWVLAITVPAHGAKVTTNFLTEHKVTMLPFPPNSPDLTVLDYYVWGALDQYLDKEAPNGFDNVTALKGAIVRAVAALDPEKIKKALWSVRVRARKCVQQGGGVFEHLL